MISGGVLEVGVGAGSCFGCSFGVSAGGEEVGTGAGGKVLVMTTSTSHSEVKTRKPPSSSVVLEDGIRSGKQVG